MKNKAKLLLLPASFLMLTACGTSANTSIPRGYTEVDVTDAAAREAFFNKVAEDVGLTYDKAMEGFKAKGSVSLKEFSYSKSRSYVYPQSPENNQSMSNSFKISDAKAEYTVGLIGLKDGIKNAKAMVEISNLGFKYEMTENGKTHTLKASDVDATVYYSDGNVYMDFSDKDLKNFVYDVIDFSYIDSNASSSQIQRDKDQAAKYFGKFVQKNVVDDVDISRYLPASLNSETLRSVASVLNEGFQEVLKNDKVKNLLKLYEDKNSKGVAIGLGLTSDPVEVDGAMVSGDLAASIAFDKQGIFKSFGFAGNANVTMVDNYSDSTYQYSKNEQAKLSKLDFGAEFEYGPKVIKLPSFSGYKDLPKD